MGMLVGVNIGAANIHNGPVRRAVVLIARIRLTEIMADAVSLYRQNGSIILWPFWPTWDRVQSV